eukprot:2652140-Lingulodinium_polyedra.AAC.1
MSTRGVVLSGKIRFGRHVWCVCSQFCTAILTVADSGESVVLINWSRLVWGPSRMGPRANSTASIV